MNTLNLVKPVSNYEKAIAIKCGWVNADKLPVRKNLLPAGFIGKRAEIEPNIPVISTKLNPHNIAVMEIISASDKIARSPFVRSNLTDILKMSNTPDGAKMVQKIFTEENIDKLDTLRTFVKNNPREYVKDKTIAKYLRTPAGLTSLFSYVSMLKASAIMDLEHLNKLFKMDLTCDAGKDVLATIGKMNLAQIEHAQKALNPSKSINVLS